MWLIDFIFGRPLRSAEERGEKLDTRAGIPVFGLDALSSAAYGPEAALTLLIPLGVAGIQYIIPITAAIIILLTIVYFSYRQTIEAYPTGGGSYTVARENLGNFAGLLAASALMVDYVLTAAVGISAGVGALVSAVPTLLPHTLMICLGILVLVTVVNLRGVRAAGLTFLAPTYLFIATMLITLGWGLAKAIAAGGHPAPVVAPPEMHAVATALSAWVLLKAFSSGCTAMTGVEAVSNGVKAFSEPVVKTAQRTLTAIIALLIVFLAGIAYLAHAYHIGATEPGSAGYQSVLSQLIAAVAGRNVFYDAAIASILGVLALSANTAFADFPRLCRMVAEDGFLPVPFVQRGRRLVYSQGIYVLALVCAVLLILFGGVTDRLIPLFAVGAFLAFTLSQAGMVAHWIRKRGKRARRNMLINGLGAVATAGTVIVVTVSKFAEGAWITTLLIPAIIMLMYSIRRHYDRVIRETTEPNPLSLEGCEKPLVVVPIDGWNKIAEKGLKFALTLSSEVQAVHVETGEGSDELPTHWKRCVEAPAIEAGLPAPPLNVVKSPYRFVVNPIVDFIQDLEQKHPDRQIAVVVPELVEHHWYQYLLHNQRPKWLKALLLLKGSSRIVLITVPWRLTHEKDDGIRGSREG
ncbi:MAG TPA: APC family permease [Terriglobia bacterium]|nr:APC family permease [Terriglobia bacterium]